MTIEELETILESPKYKKYERYLNSFFSLIKDEQDRVLAGHKRFGEYVWFYTEHTRLLVLLLQNALAAGSNTVGQVLQVESLEQTLKYVTFDATHLKLAKMVKK